MNKVPVSELALITRIKRGLKKQGLRVYKARHWNINTGDFYAVNDNNFIDWTMSYMNLEQWSRENGFLQPYEELVF